MELYYSLLFVMLVFLKVDAVSEYPEMQEDDWVDPFDMINYDHASKSMIKKPRKPVPESESLGCREAGETEKELKLCKEKLGDCSKQLRELYSPTVRPKMKSQTATRVTSGDPKPTTGTIGEHQDCVRSKRFMRRFINILLQASKLNEDMPRSLDTKLHISVTTEQLKVLQEFSRGRDDITLQELDDVLTSVLSAGRINIFSQDFIPWSVVFNFFQSREMLLAFVLGCLPAFLVWKILSGHSVMRVMILFLMSSFIISFSVTYCRMYKQAEIKQFATIKKHPEIPSHCRPPSELSWMETIGELIRTRISHHPDECNKYYEVVMLDPFLEVTPALVLSEMLASFFLHPSGMLGSAIANFSNSILGNLPFGANWIVLFASFFVLIALIFASCGGVLRLPFYLGGLELSGRHPQESVTARPQASVPTEQHQKQITDQQIHNKTINSLMQAAEASDTGLVIMNIQGARSLFADGNSTLLQRNTIEELKPKKTVINYTFEEREGAVTDDVVHDPGCCGDSQLRCSHTENNAVVELVSILQPKKKRTEEVRLRKAVSFSDDCVSKQSQIERENVGTQYPRKTQNDTEVKTLPIKSCSCSSIKKEECVTSAPLVTVASSTRKLSAEETFRHSGNDSDDDNEETSFVKL